MKHLLIVAFFAALGPVWAQTLEEGFKAPPDSAKPHTWYHMMNGNVTKEGITCDSGHSRSLSRATECTKNKERNEQ